MILAFLLALTAQASPDSPAAAILDLLKRPPSPEQVEQHKRARAAGRACHIAVLGQNYRPQPAIWKVADADTTIYLFGTFHRLPVDFDWRSPQLDAIVAQADTLITENGVGGQDAPTLWSLQKLAGTQEPPPRPLADRLTGERRAKWIGMRAMAVPDLLAGFDRMPDWLVALTIGLMAEVTHEPQMEGGVESQLVSIFKKAGKPIEAIEDTESVLKRVHHIPVRQQRKMLTDAFDAIDLPSPLEQRMAPFHSWARGEHQASSLLTSRVGYAAALRDTLLSSRNSAWADVIERRMQRPGTALVAVGAAHLDGKGSLRDLLAAKGVTAERISPVTAPAPRPAFVPKPEKWNDCGAYIVGDKMPEAGVE